MIFRKRQVYSKSQIFSEDNKQQSLFADKAAPKTWVRIVKWIFFLSLFAFLGILAASIANAQSIQPDHENDLSSQQNEEQFSSLNDATAHTESGQVFFKTDRGQFVKAIHMETKVDVDINGMIATVEYQQTFENDSDDWREAVYVFPLSENAAVNEMEMRIGDRLIRSEIKEKEEARQIYEQAKSEGKKVALTEQQRPNLFTQKVANIAPHEKIEISLSYVQRIEYDAGSFSFYLPTTLTPRFIPGISLNSVDDLDAEKELTSSAFGWASATTIVPDAHEITPYMLKANADTLLNPISINVQLNAGLELGDIKSRNYSIHQRKNTLNDAESPYEISLSNKQESMDRDFWLEWTPIATSQPEAAVFEEQVNGDDYALLMLMPPQIADDLAQSLAREVIFIIDTSGSMAGTSILQAKASLQMALDRLDSNDRFNIIEFNSRHRSLFNNPVSATSHNLGRAKTFVRSLNSGGGTNMYPALDQALTMESDEDLIKQILFITDGAIGNEDQLFGLIQSKLGHARLFNVGIGSAPNSHFMSRSAQFGRGTYEYISNQNEISEHMSNLFRKLESPVLSDLKITWPNALSGQIEQFPNRIPDLYAGEPLVLSIKANNGEDLSGQVIITGSTAGANWSRTLNLDSRSQNKGVSTIWAREKIAALMDEKIRGRDESEIREEVIEVAIPHKLISAYTSLIAVEEVISRDNPLPLKPGVVPNAVAAGQVPQSTAYPKTSTSMPLHILLGNLFLLMLAGLYRSKFILAIKSLKRLCSF